MRGLFDELYKEKYKYINALDALSFLVSDDGYPVSKIAKFFLVNDYHKSVKTYKENHLEQMVLVDLSQQDSSIDSCYQTTKDILTKALDNFIYNGDDRIQPYKKYDYENYFWLKEELFNFEGFKKLGIEIDNEDYEKYLTYKRINELDEHARVVKVFKDWEENLNSYWNLRVVPKIFEHSGNTITILDILRVTIRYYTVSYQYLGAFLHKFIYSPNDNLLDGTQNNVLLRFIEDLSNLPDERLYRPININDILMDDFSCSLVHWNVNDLATFFVKQDNKIYEYESILPRFCRENNDNETFPHENKKLKIELDQAKERIKQLEENDQLKAHITEIKSQHDNTSEPLKLSGIQAINQHKKDLAGMARIIASKQWADDNTVLIGTMADNVYRDVAKYTTVMPDTTETVKNWIRVVAPEGAKKRGRPSNNN